MINGLKAKINSFDAAADDIYTRARKDWEDKEASNKAYDRIVGKVDDVKAELTAAAEFVDNYVITELYEDLVSAENSIEALLEDATEWRVAGSCVRNETLAESRCNTITATLKSLYARANGYEQSRILKEFDVLRGEQNKAAAAVVGKPEEEEVDAYIAKIDDLVVKFEKAIDSKGEIGKLDDEKPNRRNISYMRTLLPTCVPNLQLTTIPICPILFIRNLWLRSVKLKRIGKLKQRRSTVCTPMYRQSSSLPWLLSAHR